MSYPRIHCPQRTDQSFRNRVDDDHHKEETPLIQLPIDMVEDFIVADSLHLFDLGVMRRCLHGWREGSYNFRTKLSRRQADLLSEMLENCNKTRPNDIHRAIRSLKHLKFWKGSEYRVFLLYLGIVVLKDFLSVEVYDHFLMLSCAVSILSCNEYMKYINIAKSLLEDYIEKFIEIYGIDSISSNIHNLCHVTDDVKKFGPLPLLSSYPFENYLGHLKSLVRHGNLPLSQISKRVIELSKLNALDINKREGTYVKKKLNELPEHPNCKNVYNELHLSKEFVLCADNKNQCFMTKTGDIVFMLNATYFKDEIHVYGIRLKTFYDFFSKPFASSKLNILATKAKIQKSIEHYKFDTDPPGLYSIKDIKCKLFRIQYNDEFVILPLLHTFLS
ncbi:unnamed protein product [Callosobruchus maculatus]|uniref:Uncharacterized protein n=2 Tax=Callosobruchus maculatus TaxID=64391 RepID=A0A653BWA4_CALMS|nr:unnamed protein product [Callosobruchus maculatus]